MGARNASRAPGVPAGRVAPGGVAPGGVAAGPENSEALAAPWEADARTSRGTSIRPPGEYTVVGFSTRPRSRPGAAGGAAWRRWPAGLRRADFPLRVNANTSSVTRPITRPARARAAPRLLAWLPAWWVTALATTTIPPTPTITALTTDRVMTSRTLPAGAVSERTAQRSHRALRPASHTGRSAHYDLLHRGDTAEPIRYGHDHSGG